MSRRQALDGARREGPRWPQSCIASSSARRRRGSSSTRRVRRLEAESRRPWECAAVASSHLLDAEGDVLRPSDQPLNKITALGPVRTRLAVEEHEEEVEKHLEFLSSRAC